MYAVQRTPNVYPLYQYNVTQLKDRATVQYQKQFEISGLVCVYEMRERKKNFCVG